MPTVSDTLTKTLSNAPLSTLIEKLGLAIASAQAALDKNSVAIANEMARTKIELGDGKEYNLIALGFAPTFYAFTEATVEAKLEFSMAESTSFSVGTEVKAQIYMVAVSVNASYARKFDMSAQGSSSIAARLISLPPPERYQELLKEVSDREPINIVKVLNAKYDSSGQKFDKSGDLEIEYRPYKEKDGGMVYILGAKYYKYSDNKYIETDKPDFKY